MERSALILENSPWFIVLCLLVGGLFAYFLYQHKGPWGPTVHKVLTALRFLLVSILCFLLVGPILKQIKNRIERPSIVLAVDNSSSLQEVMDSTILNQELTKIWQLHDQLTELGYEAVIRNLSKTLPAQNRDSLRFDHPSTPLTGVLQDIQSEFEGRNLNSVILFTDGIYNQGLSPVFIPYQFPIHTMGWGDTIPQRDLRLKALHYNKIAYQGNQFIIRAEVSNNGFNDQNVQMVLSEGNQVLQRKSMALTQSPQLLEVDFTLDAATKGLKDYRIAVAPVDGEFSTVNNYRHAYIEVIEGKRNILLAARSPHPDIKALKSALENNQNYQFETYIPGISTPQSEEYDLVILHQISRQETNRIPVIANMYQAEVPLWFIVGSRSNISRFNEENQILNIELINSQRDQVTAEVNTGFGKFQLTPQLQQLLPGFNPVTVPFANYEISGGAEVLLTQKVGNLTTDHPLLAVMDDGDQKTAVMLGEGIWQWRLNEYQQNQNFEYFDELVGKLVQYLSSEEDKTRFRVYPISSEFNISEPAILETEIYNEIYEEVYGYNVDMDLRQPDGSVQSYSYTTSEGNTQYRIGGLQAGVYSYTARSEIEGQIRTSRGQFSITELQLEALELTADHQVLRSLSERTGGQFFTMQQWENLSTTLASAPAQGVIFTEEAFLPIIRWPWALLVLLLLIAVEWFFRKYHGSY